MRTRITVGDVDIRLDGHELTYSQLRALLKAATAAALTGALASKVEPDEPSNGTSLGFTAHLDLDAGRHDPPQAPWYDGEDETT